MYDIYTVLQNSRNDIILYNHKGKLLTMLAI